VTEAPVIRQYPRVELAPEDLRIDTFVVRRGPSPVRVTHIPTGVSVMVEDQETTQANHEVAMSCLRELLTDTAGE